MLLLIGVSTVMYWMNLAFLCCKNDTEYMGHPVNLVPIPFANLYENRVETTYSTTTYYIAPTPTITIV